MLTMFCDADEVLPLSSDIAEKLYESGSPYAGPTRIDPKPWSEPVDIRGVGPESIYS